LALALWFVLAFIDLMPAVFLFPLSFVTTAVFGGAVLPFMFAGRLAFVSTTPSRPAPFVFDVDAAFALARVAFVLFELFVFVSLPHAASAPPKASVASRVAIRLIGLLPCSSKLYR
jgi:hypothetical protein